ncbi:MAG: hypothetical protein HYY57_06620, partial [Candidatus Omnitrophica bacterium]|nr:hypothetical protein [Candidatus Omnitrophota bacterium]
MPCDLRVRLGSLVLQNPVLAAAGTFGYGVEFSKTVSLKQLGAVVIKTLTRNPKQGNLPPRLAETPSGMLNAVGLQNMGIEPFVQQMLPKLKGCGTKILVSILGESEQEVIEMVECLDQAEGVDGIELNLSCPNLKGGQGGRETSVSRHSLTSEDCAGSVAGDEGRGYDSTSTPAPRPPPPAP